MTEWQFAAVSSITLFFHSKVCFFFFLAPHWVGSCQSVLMSRRDGQWQTGRKTDRSSGMERTWNSVWRLISERRRRWDRLSVLEMARLRSGGKSEEWGDLKDLLMAHVSPLAVLLYYRPLCSFLLTPSLSLTPTLLPLPTSYHLGQATRPIGKHGNQQEADNNW